MNSICSVYRGEDDRLFITEYNGKSWITNTAIKNIPTSTIDPRSDRSPAISVFSNDMYLIYKGKGNNDIFMAWREAASGVWAGDKKLSSFSGGIDAKTSDSPASVYANGNIYLIYKGDGNDYLYFAAFNGTTWSGGQRIVIVKDNKKTEPRTNHAVDIVAYNNYLWVIYKAVDGKDLFWMKYNISEGVWSGDIRISESEGTKIDPKTTGNNPGLVVFDKKIHAFYCGIGNNGTIYQLTYSEGPNGDSPCWEGNTQITVTGSEQVPLASQAPRGIDYSNDKMVVIFPGYKSSTLYMLEYQNGAWSGNKALKTADKYISSENHPEMSYMPVNPADNADWMQGINDKNVSIGQINLPATHDSAAIQSYTYARGFYACHNISLTGQFNLGVRVFDIRLQITFDAGNGLYTFTTCHGDIASSLGFNVYQSLESALDEFEACLDSHQTEIAVVILKIDDPKINDDQFPEAYNQLCELLGQYPVLTPDDLPSLKDAAGNIIIYNRFTNIAYADKRFGATFHWPKNTKGEFIPANGANRLFNFYVQDCYLTTGGYKYEYYINAVNYVNESLPGAYDVFINYATNNLVLYADYIQSKLIQHWGSMEPSQRPDILGWTFFDFENKTFLKRDYITGKEGRISSINIISYIISSNFQFGAYPNTYEIIGNGKDENLS